ALVFVAIPLETFVSSSRTVVGIITSALLRALAFTLRLLGNIARYSGKIVSNLYDLIIFGPLWLESAMTNKQGTRKSDARLAGHPVNTDYQEAT
ncbi:MAG: hypothetical protein KJO03_09215, partial [Gammaproteobacteria bacterium]|nr:hypothetical protein [Gammaproteobacteria bacterium]